MIALPRAYRAALSALSVARETSLDKGTTDYLEALCTRAYFAVYGNKEKLSSRLYGFFAEGWPSAVRALWRETLVSLVLSLLGVAVAYLLVSSDADWYYSFMPGELAGGRSPASSTESLREGLYHDGGASGLSVFAAFLLSNNARVAIFAFALGFAFCVPTVALLIYNGCALGAFYALYVERGLGVELTGWLFIHGVTELFAIVLAGAAGLKIGTALAFPGACSRLDAAAEAGRQAAGVIAGVVVMLAIAALLEGFGRQLVTSDLARFAIAGVTAVLWGTYFYAPRPAAEEPA
nr:stage II sporulation protein M [Parvularcula dongshanensis]